MNSLNELFEESVKDIYNAEKQLLKALPKMAKMAQNEQLKQMIQNHISQTEEQVRRLEQAAKECGFKPNGMVCKGMQGLIEEATEHMGKAKPSPVTDAMIIELAQKTEHYEIASYGTIIEWCKLLGQNNVVELLKQNLNEEEQTDKMLSELAESQVNRQACEMPMPETRPKSTSKARTGGRTMKDKVSVR